VTVIRDPITPQAKLIVTGGKTESLRECKRLLRDAFPHARVRNAGFRCVFVIESENDPLTLAADLEHQAHSFIGHVTSVLSKTETNADAISEAAVRIGTAHIGADESFCFRIHKRGSHGLVEDTGTLEKRIGSAIWSALQQKYGKKPLVDLENPDVSVVGEVLGPWTAIGISKKVWRETIMEMPERRVS
jgi:tRNA(Ser,Leu) C12 N-acetylase TAN1